MSWKSKAAIIKNISQPDQKQGKAVEQAQTEIDIQITGEYFLGFMQDPNLFLPEHFRTVWLDQANGILALVGRKKADPATERCQEILFLKSKWQPNTIADWIKQHQPLT